jgi:hypothetical protein
MKFRFNYEKNYENTKNDINSMNNKIELYSFYNDLTVLENFGD